VQDQGLDVREISNHYIIFWCHLMSTCLIFSSFFQKTPVKKHAHAFQRNAFSALQNYLAIEEQQGVAPFRAFMSLKLAQMNKTRTERDNNDQDCASVRDEEANSPANLDCETMSESAVNVGNSFSDYFSSASDSEESDAEESDYDSVCPDMVPDDAEESDYDSVYPDMVPDVICKK